MTQSAEHVVAKALCSGQCVRPELLNGSGVCPRHWNRALLIVACLRSAGLLIDDSDIETDTP